MREELYESGFGNCAAAGVFLFDRCYLVCKLDPTENRYRDSKAVHKAGGRDNGVLSVI